MVTNRYTLYLVTYCSKHMGHTCFLFTSYHNETVKSLVSLPRDSFSSYSNFFSLQTNISFPAALYPDLLIKITIEKDSLYIELIQLQTYCATNANNIQKEEFYNGWEYLIVINTFSLCVTFYYQSGLVANNSSILRFLLLCIHLLATNDLLLLG